MKMKFLGGAGEAGHLCIALQTGESNVLVDCGLRSGRGTGPSGLRDLEAIDAVILTHAHIDHTGGLPLLSSYELLEEDADIFCTLPTASLLKVLLWDSFKLQKERWSRNDRKPPYRAEDVEEILDRVSTIPYQKFSVTEDVKAEFRNSGHILGSAWVRLLVAGRSILVTGDLGEGRSNHLPPAAYPPKSDLLITEATYGATRQHPSFSEECKKLVDLVSEEVPVLIPTFAVGRSMDILRLLKLRGVDPKRIWYDGMITDVLPYYRSFVSDVYMSPSVVKGAKLSGDPHPFVPEEARTPSTVEERRRIVTEEEDPIFVSPSGMLEGGWSPFYLSELATNRDEAKVVLVSYQAESTPGRELVEARERGIDAEVTVSILAEPGEMDEESAFRSKKIRVPKEWIETLNFSSHASANFLLGFARKALPRRIFISHGDQKNSSTFREILSADPALKNVETKIPRTGDGFEIEKRVPSSLEARVKALEERVSSLERVKSNSIDEAEDQNG